MWRCGRKDNNNFPDPEHHLIINSYTESRQKHIYSLNFDINQNTSMQNLNSQTCSMVFCNLGRLGANGMAFKTFELYKTKDLSMQSVQTCIGGSIQEKSYHSTLHFGLDQLVMRCAKSLLGPGGLQCRLYTILKILNCGVKKLRLCDIGHSCLVTF